jgi:hypothetical protein
MKIKKALPILDRFVTWASPTRIIMLTCVALVLIGSLTVFEKRDAIVKGLTDHDGVEVSISQEPKLELPSETQEQIIKLVKRSPDISFIAVVSANLRVNQRDTVFYYSDEHTIDLAMRNLLASSGSTYPIFTTNDKSNVQMVSVINGEFSCQKFGDTIFATRLPAAANDMPHICQVSMPPYYGEFSGYILFGLKKVPDKMGMDDLRLEAIKLSTDIYAKTMPKNRKF